MRTILAFLSALLLASAAFSESAPARLADGFNGVGARGGRAAAGAVEDAAIRTQREAAERARQEVIERQNREAFDRAQQAAAERAQRESQSSALEKQRRTLERARQQQRQSVVQETLPSPSFTTRMQPNKGQGGAVVTSSQGGSITTTGRYTRDVDRIVQTPRDQLSARPPLLRDSTLNRAKLSQSGSQLDPTDASGQLTRAGRALQKHSNRPNSSFPPTNGSPTNWNNAGQRELDNIIENPNSSIRYGNRHNGYDIIIPSGKGAAFDSRSIFRGFLEPPRG